MKSEANKLIEFLSKEAKDPATPLLRVCEIVGSWRVLSFLGGGGFGEVYRVEHIRAGIVCALKILKVDTENAKKRFLKEAIFVAQHSQVGMPRFYEMETNEGGRPYFVMEMLLPKELPSRGRDVAFLLKRLCRIVGTLHDEGLVHRDIKPSNILYRENGDVVLVDYGLVKNADNNGVSHVASNSLTCANGAVGTEHYAAPEQLAGHPIDCHADVHALGVLMDTCFKGRIPWRWRRIVCRATSSLVGQRYSSCAALSRAISFRFAVEIIVGVVVSVAAFLAIIMHLDTPTHVTDFDLLDSSVQNVEKAVDAKNVSDGAGDWLTP